jgi:hypothetical protein
LITEFLGFGTLLQSNDIKMTARSLIGRIVQQEDINFLLTNRLPRRWLAQFVGWLSRIRMAQALMRLEEQAAQGRDRPR